MTESMYAKAEQRNIKASRDGFYVEEACCMSCGVPQHIAPELVGWKNGKDTTLCY